MKLEFSGFEKKLINYFYRIELARKNKMIKSSKDNILPKYILNRRIKIITNGEVVFDSNDFKGGDIPISIQYSIKQYGYPEKMKRNSKTPLIYNITSKVSPLFPSSEEQNLYISKL